VTEGGSCLADVAREGEVQCAECGREASLAVAEREGWRRYGGGDGDLDALCVRCSHVLSAAPVPVVTPR
jgi:hypothetical protein